MFFKEIESVSKIIKPILKEKRVKIFSHYDADGISSAAILIKMLTRAGMDFELKILNQLTANTMKGIEPELDEKTFLILSDFGSGQLEFLKSEGLLDKSYVLVLDHHEPAAVEHPNLFHLNPLVFGEEEVSSSIVCYLLAKSFDSSNVDLIDLAVAGAVGDMQDDKWEFKGLARKILEEAVQLGKVAATRGLRLYGRTSRPVHKTLEYSFDPLIPGVTGSESGAAQFLAELGIPLKENGAWRRLCDLTFDEEKKLATAIIVERLKFRHKDAADVFGDVYTFIGWPEELQDAREFATLLNACGRLGEPEVGLRLCLGDMAALDDSWRVMGDYKKVISDGVNWLRDGCLQEGRGVERREGAAYILGGGRIPESVIGTVVSIALSSNIIGEEKPLVGFADAGDGAGGEYVKVSARIPRNLNLNLRNIISGAARAVGGEGGGHQFAAGGLIPRGKEKEFIDETEKILNGLLRDGAGRARQTS